VPTAVNTSGVLSGKTILSIAASTNNTCALASDHEVYCWGQNNNGQLGNNTTTQSLVPVAVSTSGVLSGKTVLALSGSGDTFCAIASDNNAYCWGWGYYGQLGNNATSDSSVPVAVSTSGVLSGKTIKYISASEDHVCAIASDNNAYCWGDDNEGALGNNSSTSSSVPVAVNTSGVLSGKTLTAISSGWDHTCAIASDSNAYCWGYNEGGQLGNNTTTQSLVPVAVSTSGVLSGKTILSLATGVDDTCAIASNNLAYCWGDNADGNLGNNSTTNALVPVAVYTSGVLSGLTINAISTSWNTCVIASDGNSYCWGYNSFGQLGNNISGVNVNQVPVATYPPY
jgi:alpha-tubulin suppressor-like RCC1 family protein